jgi:hypothetical protein
MKKIKLITCILFVICTIAQAHSQHLERSTFEVGGGIGRRAFIDSKTAMLRGTVSSYYNLRLHKLWDLKLGADAIYWDITYKGNFNNDPGYMIRVSSYEHWAYAAVMGYDFKMNRLIFTGAVGRYLHFNGLYDLKYYTKVGFRYLITPHLTGGFYMRAHSNEADYIDFGLSIKL